jgi:hypothetical protein
MPPPTDRLPGTRPVPKRARPVPDAVARPAPEAVPARPAPDAIARPVPDEVLRQVAELAHVPTAQHEFFFEVVRDSVQTACDLNALAKGGLTNKKGATLHRAALDFYETLKTLNKDEGKFIERILDSKAKFIFDRISDGGVDELRKTAYQLALLFSLITGKPLPRYPHQGPQPRQRGKKSGWVKHPRFNEFAFNIYLSAKVAGGNLTFDKNGLGGTWVDAIEMLAPHLPAGFVPEPFPGSALQRL